VLKLGAKIDQRLIDDYDINIEQSLYIVQKVMWDFTLN